MKEKIGIPVLHPSNTIQVAQTGFVFRGRTMNISRAISSPAAFFCVCCCGCINI